MENRMKAFVLEKLQLKAKKYLDSDEAESSFNSEKRITDDYEGRQLLELLQNADDEITDETKDKCIKISFINNELIVYNNGRSFSEGGIKSLMYSDRSPKHKENLDEIGCKGLGFRSVLGWADEIAIDSGDLHVEFSEKIAQNQLKQLLGEKYSKSIEASTLEFPIWNEKPEKCSYTTRIKLKTKNSKKIIEQINQQIDNLDSELLLFLNHATELEIKTQNKDLIFRKEYRNNNKNAPTLIEISKGKVINKTDWLVLTTEEKCKDEGKEKRFRVSLAYKEDGTKPKKQVIYSYFPTKISFDYPFLVHATFELSSNRNNLIEKDVNSKIVKTIAKMMVQLALKIRNKNADYKALWLLLAYWNFPQDLKDYNIEEFLTKEIETAKLFPNINGKYASLDEELVYDEYNLGNYLEGENFNDLILNCDEELNRLSGTNVYSSTKSKFREKFNDFDITDRYEEQYMIKIINNYIDKVSLNPQNKKKIAGIAVALSNYDDPKYNNEKFHLIINDKNKILNCDRSTFVKDSSKLTSPPEFLKYDFLDVQYQKYLQETANNDDYADEDSLFEWMGIYHASFETIIENANKLIEKDIDKHNLDKANEKSILLIKWLWSNRKILEEYDINNIYLPDRNKELIISNNLYFGSEYSNSLIEDLLRKVENVHYIANIRKYIEEECDDKELVKFLEDLNVNKYPKKYGEHKFFSYRYVSEQQIDRDYCKELINIYPKQDIKFKSSKQEYATRESALYGVDFRFPITNIENIIDILNTADTKYILQWVSEDEELKNLISGDKIDKITEHYDFGFVNPLYGVRCGNMSSYDSEPKLKKVKSYISFLFESIKWIDNDDKKYAISDCILDKEYGSILKPILISINTDVYVDNEKQRKSLSKRYKDIFSDMGVVDNITKLSYTKIYDILSHLPNVDENGKYAKSIYNALVKADKKFDAKDIEPSENYEKYKNGKGKLFTNNGYVVNSEVAYLNNDKEISKKIKNNYNLIDLPSRLNTTLVKNIFNVDKLKIKSSIVGEPIRHEKANDFAEFFKEFKLYAFCYKTDTVSDEDVIRRYCDLKVSLCSDITAQYNDDIVSLEDYEYIKSKDTYYVKYPENEVIKFFNNKKLGKTIADILCSFFDAYSENDKYRLLFSCQNNKDREEYILEDNSDGDIFKRTRNKLNLIGSTKDQFKDLLLYISTENPNEYEKYIDLIDCERLNDEKNIIPITNCFKAAKKDLEDYNSQRPEIEINFIPFYRKMVDDAKEKYKKYYVTKLYDSLLNDSIENKKTLMDKINEYDEIDVAVVNSVKFNPENSVISTLNIDVSKYTDLNKVYFENEKKWINTKEDKAVAKEIAKQNEWHSLIYFAEYEALDNEYSKQLNYKETDNTIDDKEPYAYLSDFVMVETTPITKEMTARKKSRNTKGVGFPSTHNKNNEETGMKGERIVYETLKKQGKNVKWVSEYAYDAGINSDGKAGLGYDMYVDEETGREFIEVKSSTGTQIYFEMSESEYQFACKNYNHYHIYFVENVNSKSVIKELIGYFDKDGFNEEKGLLKISGYTISAKEK